jgi:thymidylate synthase ThyX
VAYAAQILLDSTYNNSRLTTFVVTYPRIVHSEFMTHRVFSRNAASSRAIPFKKMLEQVRTDPFYPVWWGSNQPGMVADREVSNIGLAKASWTEALDQAIESAQALDKAGLHKQIVNRILEPFSWITVILTGTDYDNFFLLRCAKDAQPELRKIALLMKDLYYTNVPIERSLHAPYIQPDEEHLPALDKMKISAARCARVSYLTHEGTRDVSKDFVLAERLLSSRHMSPFEHPCVPSDGRNANLTGWKAYRKEIPGEAGT